MADTGMLIREFLAERRAAKAGFHVDDISAYLREHGVSDIEASMAVEGWQSEQDGPDYHFITALGLPPDFREMTLDQAQRFYEARIDLMRRGDAAQARFNAAADQLRAAFGGRRDITIGDLAAEPEHAGTVEEYCAADAEFTVIVRVLDGMNAYDPHVQDKQEGV